MSKLSLRMGEVERLPKQPGFWSVEDRLRESSAQGDPLEKLLEIVDFELFRPVLDEVFGVADRAKGGRPPFDAVLKFKMLYLQAQHGLSFEQTEHLVRDRLSWMRFAGCRSPTRCRTRTRFRISARC